MNKIFALLKKTGLVTNVIGLFFAILNAALISKFGFDSEPVAILTQIEMLVTLFVAKNKLIDEEPSINVENITRDN